MGTNVYNSIIKNSKRVLGLNLEKLDRSYLEGLCKVISEELNIRNINVNENRQECIELFKEILKDGEPVPFQVNSNKSGFDIEYYETRTEAYNRCKELNDKFLSPDTFFYVFEPSFT